MMVVSPSTETAGRLGEWVNRHPVAAFFGLAYAISWVAWIPWAFGYQDGAGAVLFIVGGFGPLAAAVIITKSTGGSIRAWARGIRAWRVPARYYAYALGLPPLLFVAINAELALLGQQVDLALLPGRLMGYVGTLIFVAILGGGLEEPGWRGFALPRLEQRHSPLRATLILGFVWGVWHIPAYGTPIAFVVPLVLAFFYTWLYNRTGSVLLCILLHASFTPAIDQLVLTRDSATVDVAIFMTLVVAALTLIVITRGRLGSNETTREEDPSWIPSSSSLRRAPPSDDKRIVAGQPAGTGWRVSSRS